MRDFKIFFFKVGNGHCSYVEFPNGDNGMIDVKVSKERGDDNIIDILKNASISQIDNLWITHPHRDHIGGLKELIDNFKVNVFYYSPVKFEPDPVYDDWLIYEQLKKGFYCNEKYRATEGIYTTIDNDVRIDYLAPSYSVMMYPSGNVNNDGLLLKINCRRHNILIPGDIEEDGWDSITDYLIGSTTLLLASHHGNNSGFNSKKIKAMNLSFAVISAGAKTEHDADQKYRNVVKRNVYTTRQKRIVAKIDENNTLHMID